MSRSACHDALLLSICNEHQVTTDMFTVFFGENLAMLIAFGNTAYNWIFKRIKATDSFKKNYATNEFKMSPCLFDSLRTSQSFFAYDSLRTSLWFITYFLDETPSNENHKLMWVCMVNDACTITNNWLPIRRKETHCECAHTDCQTINKILP